MPKPKTMIRAAVDDDRPLWDAFVTKHGGTLFHTWGWMDLMAEGHGDEPYRLIAEEDDEMVGLFTALRRKKFGGYWAVHPLLTTFGGYLIAEDEEPRYAAQRSTLHRRNVAMNARLMNDFKLVNVQTLGMDVRDHQQAGFNISPRFTYCVDLEADWKKLFMRCENSTRRQVNKARNNEDLELTRDIEVGEAQELVKQTFEKGGGSSPVPPQLVEELLRNPMLDGLRRVHAVRDLHDQPLGFIVWFRDAEKNFAHYVLAANHPEALSTGVSSWLVWEAIKQAAIEGIACWEFCGANSPKIAKFKEGFGPRPVAYYDLEWSRPWWLAALRRWRQGR